MVPTYYGLNFKSAEQKQIFVETLEIYGVYGKFRYRVDDEIPLTDDQNPPCKRASER